MAGKVVTNRKPGGVMPPGFVYMFSIMIHKASKTLTAPASEDFRPE